MRFLRHKEGPPQGLGFSDAAKRAQPSMCRAKELKNILCWAQLLRSSSTTTQGPPQGLGCCDAAQRVWSHDVSDQGS